MKALSKGQTLIQNPSIRIAMAIVVAYAGFVTYYKITGSGGNRSGSTGQFNTGSNHMSGESALAAGHGGEALSRSANNNQNPDLVSAEETIQAEGDKNKLMMLIQQAEGESDSARRRSAIAKLGTQAFTPETLAALQVVLAHDAVAANRIQALNALARLAKENASQMGSFINALTPALQDSDPAVSNTAQNLIDQLNGVSKPPVAATNSIADASDAERRAVAALSLRATDNPSDARRRSAIADLGIRMLTPESTKALQSAISQDPVVANRIQAVNSLSTQFKLHGDTNGVISNLLRPALNDANPSVVVAAQNALNELAKVNP